MSDVDAPVQNGVSAEDDFVDANEGEEVKKVEVTGDEEAQPEEPAANGVATEDDRTEDQVPDIGTENAVDPMTTSMDGIEDIPAQEETPADEGADIQVEKFEDAPEEPAQAEETPAEETPAEEEVEQAAEEVEQPTEEVEPPAEELIDVPVEETPEVPEETPEEPAAEEQPEETPAEEEVPAEEEQKENGFELQAPPSPKRPRTPHDLDNEPTTPGLSAQGSAVQSQKGSAPATPSATGDEVRGSQLGSQLGSQAASNAGSNAGSAVPSNAGSAVPSNAGSAVPSNAGSQPGTPRPESNAGSQPATPRSTRSSKVGEPTTPRVSEPATPRSKLANGSIPGTPKDSNAGSAVATPKTGASSTKAFDFENDAPRTPKRTTFQEDNLSVTRSPRTPRSPKTPSVAESTEQQAEVSKEPTPVDEDQPKSQTEEAPVEDSEAPVEQSDETPVEQSDEPAVETDEAPVEKSEEVEKSDDAPVETSDEVPARNRVQSPSPPPRRAARDTSGTDYTPYDQDSHRETVPTRLPTTTSFNSWNPPERESYKPISPWVTSSGNKYSEYTPSTTYHPPSQYTSIFDDTVNAGPFSQSLYSTNRLLERSRSRSRSRQKALRHSSFQRYANQVPSPFRSGEYANRSSSLSRGLSRPYTSFTSFLDYSGSKNYELGRHGSRGSLYDSTQALSRTNSRGNIDFYLGAGRISRVDSFVNNLNSRYEWQVPATYELYKSSSRGQLSYAPLNQYNTRVGELQRSLSRERFVHDSLKNKYSKVSYQLEQACKQMDLLRTNSYSSLRSGLDTPRTSVYSHFYPHY